MKTHLSMTTLLAMVLVWGCALASETKEKAGWTILFDGKSLDAWRAGDPQKPLPTKWSIVDGVLQYDPAAQGTGGDILTKEDYSDFELELEFKLTKGANSGIKYFFVNGLGLEYQILDDVNHPDAKNGRNGNRTVASLYDLKTADPNKPVNPIGEWNTAKIVAKGKRVEHWLNGKKVLQYERGSQEFTELVAISKYKDNKGFGLAEKGPILLQDHGNKVWFRNIRIRKL